MSRIYLKLLFFFFAAALTVSVSLQFLQPPPSPTTPTPPSPSPYPSPSPTAIPIESLTLEQKVGQLFVVGYYQHNYIDDQLELIRQNQLSGLIVMGPNVADPDTASATHQKIQVLQNQLDYPLIISIDEEGEVITRLEDQLQEQTPQSQIESPTQAFQVASQRGQELASFGYNVVYAPVLDYATPESFLYSRTFHTPKSFLPSLASSMIEGYQANHITAVPKHFPGHPLDSIDSHDHLPTSTMSAQLFDNHISQYRQLIATNPPQILMTGHILFEEVDPTYPATLSPTIITDILRDQLGYQGLIITDDLNMDAISADYSPAEAATQAFLAGNDLLLYVSDLDNQQAAIDGIIQAVESGTISESRLNQSVTRILDFKQNHLN